MKDWYSQKFLPGRLKSLKSGHAFFRQNCMQIELDGADARHGGIKRFDAAASRGGDDLKNVSATQTRAGPMN